MSVADGSRVGAPARPSQADSQADWQADWESHRRWQLTSALAATPSQRLAWLEEMIRLAYRSGALGRTKDDRTSSGDR